jgi:hypothetical protein
MVETVRESIMVDIAAGGRYMGLLAIAHNAPRHRD